MKFKEFRTACFYYVNFLIRFKSYHIVKQCVELWRYDLVYMALAEEPLAVNTVSKYLLEERVSFNVMINVEVKTLF